MAAPVAIGSGVTGGRSGDGTFTLAAPTTGGATSWIAAVVVSEGVTITPPANWTLLLSLPGGASIYRSTSSPGSVWTISGTPDPAAPTNMVITAYTTDVTVSGAPSVASDSMIAPALAVPAETLVMHLVFGANSTNSAVGYPSGSTLYRQQSRTYVSAFTTQLFVAVAHRTQATAATVPASTFTVSSRQGSDAVTLALVNVPVTPSAAPTVAGGARAFDVSVGAMSGALEYEVSRRRKNLTRPATTTQASAPAHLRRISQESLPMPSGYTYDFSGAAQRYYNVDTGFRATHNEFEGRYETGYSLAGPWNTDTAENPPFTQGHGTGVAAMAVGVTYGAAKDGIVISINAGPESGPTIDQYEDAAAFILANKGDGTVVANFSNGLPFEDPPRTLAFLDSLYLNGVAMFFAGGNSNASADRDAEAYRLFTVGSSTQADAKASYSDYGTAIDVFAPISPTTTAGSSSNSATRTADGTSEASPLAAAVGMKVLEGNPHLSPARLFEVLRSQAWVNKITGAGSAENRLLNGQSNTDLWFSRSVGTTLSFEDDGYGDDEEYEYRYRYRNSAGWSDWSPTATATTSTAAEIIPFTVGSKPVTEIFVGSHPVTAIYRGSELIWSS